MKPKRANQTPPRESSTTIIRRFTFVVLTVDLNSEESATQESEAKLQAESEPPSEPAAAPEGEAEAEQLPAGPAARLSSLLTRLPEMTSQNFIDDAAMEFSVLNSKAARNRLVKVSLWSFRYLKLQADMEVF